jgi:hypothetical protein
VRNDVLRRCVIAGVLIATLALGTESASLAEVARPAPAAWHLEDALPPLARFLGAGACTSPSDCLLGAATPSGGGLILRSTDTGATYAPTTVPPGMPGVNAIACPSSTVCFAVTSNEQSEGAFLPTSGYWILKSTDGGVTWTKVYEDPGGDPFGGATLDTISCPSTTWCMAAGPGEFLDATILVSADGGSTWTEESPFGPDNATVTVESVSCPAAGTCMAVGQDAFFTGVAVATTDGGVTWTPLTLPSSPDEVSSVACTSAVDCVAVANGGFQNDLFTTTDLGATWTQLSVAVGDSLRAVSCVDALHCVVVGSGSGGGLSSSGVAFATADGGATWSPVSVPKVAASVDNVACGAPTSCIIQATNAHDVQLTMRLHDSSISPSVLPYQTGAEWIVEASCPTPTRCTAVFEVATTSGQYLAVSTASGLGGPWASYVRLPGADDLESIACPSTTVCVAAVLSATGVTVDHSYLDVSHDGGRHWAPRLAVVGQFGVVSCATAAVCVALTPNGVARTEDGGSTWHRVVLAKQDNLYDMSCPTSRLCVAVGSVAQLPVEFRSVDGGVTWTVERTGLPKRFSLYDVACTSAARCVVLGARSDIVVPNTPYLAASVDGGRTWRPRHFRGLDFVDAAGCSRRGMCVADGTEASLAFGLAGSADGGAAWSSQPTPNGGSPLDVACGAAVCTLTMSTSAGGTALEASW